MYILKYVTKQPSRKLKDHNLEFPNVDLLTSNVSSRACTNMPQLDTALLMQRLGQVPVVVPVIYHQVAA